MPTGLLPIAARDDVGAPTDPQEVVEAFLEALAVPDLDKALTFVAEDLEYVNVGLPAIHGKAALAKFLRGLERPNGGFEVYLHAISADGPTVLTERTDVIKLGSFRAQFWVCGRFDVRDGEITLWRDAFDFLDILRGTVRGLVGIAVPSLRPKPPTSLDAAPGR
jgi:limonene-1,2-epoxide hydrolase